MAKYSAVKATVNAYIKQNGRKEITGRILNAVLNATIDSLGKYFQFAGGALPTDDPGTPDQNVCYLAGEPGVYTNFGGITIENEEVALLFWDGEWTKQRILIGIREVNASVDNQVGTPSVDVSYSGGELVLTFHNLKGDQGDTGDPAGFGTIGADINGGVGTPGVSVETSGDNTAKNLMFHFTNLKGETGVTSVVATIDDTSGTPSCQVSLEGQQLTLAFTGLKGLKGDTGVSADYPITIYNGLDSDATDQALAAAQGKVLDGKVNQLEAEITGYLAHKEIEVDSPEYTQGARKTNGTIDTSATTYGYTVPIELVDGATILLNKGEALYHGGDVAVLAEVNSNGAFVRSLISANYQTKKEEYINNSGSTMYVSISAYKTQLGYIIRSIVEAGTKDDVDLLLNRTQVLSNGVDSTPISGSQKLVQSGGVYDALDGKIGYPNISVVDSADKTLDTKYIRYSDGIAVTSYPAAGFKIRFYRADGIKKIRCYLGSTDNVPAAIAFYSSEIDTSVSNIGTYMSSSSVVAASGANWYEAEVPEGAKWIAVTNRGADLANPQINETTIPYEKAGAIAAYNRKAVFSRNEDAVSTIISSSFSGFPSHTQLEFNVTELSGNSSAYFMVYRGALCQAIYPINSIGIYFLEYEAGTTVIIRKIAVENNVLNFVLSTVKEYPVNNRIQPNYTPVTNPFELGAPFQGYYNPNSPAPEDNIVNSSSWVSYPLQKSNGYTIHINCSDFSIYYVNLVFWNTMLNKESENEITSERDVRVEDCGAWSIGIRRKNYSAITPDDVSGVVTITRTDDGFVYERQLTQKDRKQLVEKSNTIESVAQKGYDIARKGYGLNPFVGKPFYYHFAANGFILDGNDKKAIASQSIEDIELAARLGFTFIEANIHKTFDNNYVVIHGTGGAFGPECKSVDEDVITTADLQGTAINSVTLAWIKTNVRYDSFYQKYQTEIPSLEEFCESCKINNIGIFAGTSEKGAIDICVKYLGNNVIIYNPPVNIRTYFDGWIFHWNNTAATTINNIITRCKDYGSPVMYGLGPDLATQLYTDDNMEQLIEEMHNNGFLVGWTANYDTEANGRKYQKLGMDFSSSGHDVNPFEANRDIYDIDDTNHLPITTGTISDGIITLVTGQTITCENNDVLSLGKGELSIRFNGTLTIDFGSLGERENLVSNGEELIVITDYFFQRKAQLVITAEANTTISHLVYKTSHC